MLSNKGDKEIKIKFKKNKNKKKPCLVWKVIGTKKNFLLN